MTPVDFKDFEWTVGRAQRCLNLGRRQVPEQLWCPSQTLLLNLTLTYPHMNHSG